MKALLASVLKRPSCCRNILSSSRLGHEAAHRIAPLFLSVVSNNPCFVPNPSWYATTTTTTTTTTTRHNSTTSNSTLPRTNICLVGAVNAGKSVLMNLLTQSDVSIVHQTAGTTADPKICLMELHGTIGPVRLFDTPGINEEGELGILKRRKAMDSVGQADVALIVVDPFAGTAAVQSIVQVLRTVRDRQERNAQAHTADGTSPSLSSIQTAPPQPVMIYNLRAQAVQRYAQQGKSAALLMEDLEQQVIQQLPAGMTLPPTLAVDLQQPAQRDRVIHFLETHAVPRPDRSVQLLPDALAVDAHHHGRTSSSSSCSPNVVVFLNIPMDQQTPAARLLRPQAMTQEALLRHYVSTYCYRMDLTRGRSDDPVVVQTEKDRFLRALDPLLTAGDLALLITDSQAMDLVALWTLDEQGNEIVPITTFSITMIRYLSGGRLEYFANGLRQLDRMVQGTAVPKNPNGQWNVLVSEACNHTRLNLEKECADIGTVQIPQHLHRVLGADKVRVEFAFGKHVLFDPSEYDLVIHCGGCMLTPQQMDARLADLVATGVPATNYGLLLSRIQSPHALARVLKPWGIDYQWDDALELPDHDNLVG